MKNNHSRISQVLALLCLAVFAICVLLVLLSGASCYRDLVTQGEASYSKRTALQYLTTRVRQAGNVQIGDFDGCPALILEETIDGDVYITKVYCYDGWLRELYTVPAADVPPNAGTSILEASTLTAHLDGKLLTVALDGEEVLLYLPGEVGS